MKRGNLRFSEEMFRELAAKRGRFRNASEVVDTTLTPVIPLKAQGIPDEWDQLCVYLGIPTPSREFRFHPIRRWRFDFAFPDYRVALEVDGGAWTQGRHTRGAGFLADMEKLNNAILRGWRVLRCTPQTMTEGFQMCADLIQRAA